MDNAFTTAAGPTNRQANSVGKRAETWRHALFIAFHFAPEASSSGVLRTVKYVRHLEEYGWRATVITPRSDAYVTVDHRLEEQIPRSTRIVRTFWLNAKDHFSIFGVYPSIVALPDAWIGWLPWAVAAGRRVLRDDRPDVIYSTSPHATAHLVALRLARWSGLPWVADFRDPWIEDTPEPGAPKGFLYRRIDRALERRVIERCAHVVASTEQLRDVLRNRYPRSPATKFSSISNGYDEADFPAPVAASGKREQRLVMVHAGSINAEFRDPRPLFRALRRLIDEGSIDGERILVRFVGGGHFATSEAVQGAVAETALLGQVEFIPRVSYDEALRELARADVLLLLQASSDTSGLVPAKLYEYLRSRKPVLGLVYPGASADVLMKTRGGWAVDPRDDAAVDETVTMVYRAWVDNRLSNFCASLDSLSQFDRRILTGRLADLFSIVAPAQQ